MATVTTVTLEVSSTILGKILAGDGVFKKVRVLKIGARELEKPIADAITGKVVKVYDQPIGDDKLREQVTAALTPFRGSGMLARLHEALPAVKYGTLGSLVAAESAARRDNKPLMGTVENADAIREAVGLLLKVKA